MAVVSVSTLKGWFMTGLKPLQSQFHDWLDSFRHKSDPVAIAEVTGLQTALDDLSAAIGSGGGAAGGEIVSLSNGGTILLAVNQMIQFMVVRSATTQVVKCGTSSGGSQIFNVEVASGGSYAHEETFVTSASATLSLHFTSTGAFTVLIQKITFS